jgi:hypothetical protein
MLPDPSTGALQSPENPERHGEPECFRSIPGGAPRSILDLEAAYAEMARDEQREEAAQEWAEATVGDVGDETW